MQAARRNRERFPPDFMFQLTIAEAAQLKAMTESRRGANVKHPPYAFTEQGVAMLSSVLKSRRAVAINVAIMRAFVKLRESLSAHGDLAGRIRRLEDRVIELDAQVESFFSAVRGLQDSPSSPARRIGFTP